MRTPIIFLTLVLLSGCGRFFGVAPINIPRGGTTTQTNPTPTPTIKPTSSPAPTATPNPTVSPTPVPTATPVPAPPKPTCSISLDSNSVIIGTPITTTMTLSGVVTSATFGSNVYPAPLPAMMSAIITPTAAGTFTVTGSVTNISGTNTCAANFSVRESTLVAGPITTLRTFGNWNTSQTGRYGARYLLVENNQLLWLGSDPQETELIAIASTGAGTFREHLIAEKAYCVNFAVSGGDGYCSGISSLNRAVLGVAIPGLGFFGGFKSSKSGEPFHVFHIDSNGSLVMNNTISASIRREPMWMGGHYLTSGYTNSSVLAWYELDQIGQVVATSTYQNEYFNLDNSLHAWIFKNGQFVTLRQELSSGLYRVFIEKLTGPGNKLASRKILELPYDVSYPGYQLSFKNLKDIFLATLISKNQATLVSFEGSVLADIYPCVGSPVPFSTCALNQSATARIGDKIIFLISGAIPGNQFVTEVVVYNLSGQLQWRAPLATTTNPLVIHNVVEANGIEFGILSTENASNKILRLDRFRLSNGIKPSANSTLPAGTTYLSPEAGAAWLNGAYQILYASGSGEWASNPAYTVKTFRVVPQ